MKNKKFWAVIFVAFVAIAPILYFWYSYSTTTRTASNLPMVRWNAAGPKPMEIGEEFKVGAIQILDGHIFYAVLENNEWHELRLTHATKDEATIQIVELLQGAEQPSVILRRKLGNVWYVDFNLTYQGKRTSLLEWLVEKKLTL
jgi:hypothetical protein